MNAVTLPRNPFSVAYLTEASYSPQKLLELSSFLPFERVHEQLARSMNMFLVGRRGVGKTMLLKMYDPEWMMVLYASENPEHKRVRDMLPPSTLGVYLNLASPAAKLGPFQMRSSDPVWMKSALGDYLNCILLLECIRAFESMASIPAWSAAAGIRGTGLSDYPGIIRDISGGLARESSGFSPVNTLPQLREALESRVQHWTRYLNGDQTAPSPPTGHVPFGVALFEFVAALNYARVSSTPMRLFVLIDQYEALHQRSGKIDYRPMFNQAIYEASRGGTGVEFKIATREYAHDNFNLLGGGGRIELNREYGVVQLDVVARGYYEDFAMELFKKRLAAGHPELDSFDALKLVKNRFPALSAMDEAEMYVRDSTADKTKHITPFLNRWEALGLPDRTIAAAGKLLTQVHPLHAVLTCIGLSRWLRDGSADPPLKLDGGPNDRNKAFTLYLESLLTACQRRYSLGYAKFRRESETAKSVTDFIHDTEDAALFILANAYKNQRRILSGMATCLAASSHVALVFIEILNTAYDSLLLDGKDPFTNPVPTLLQSQAIYAVSEEWYTRVPDSDFGTSLQNLLAGLGGTMRRVQLELTAPQPNPNGFSVRAEDFDARRGVDVGDREDPVRLLREAVSWGIFESELHQDKARGKRRRRKFYMNRIYCPYFGINVMRRKDPVYVESLSAFVHALIEQKDPDEIKELLQRSEGSQELSLRF